MKMPPHAIYPIMNKKINFCARETLECTLLLKKLFPFRGELVCPGMGVQYVQWLPGSLFAIDAHVYRSLGGLDDRVFLFYEEQILGKKIPESGLSDGRRHGHLLFPQPLRLHQKVHEAL